MPMQQITRQLPPCGTATPTLTEGLTPDALARPGSAIGDALREPRLDGSADAVRDPGTIEFDSWLIQRH